MTRLRMSLWASGALTAALALSACDSKEDSASGAHGHQAPHGGTIVELGDDFAHLEVVLEPATGILTGYVLDGEAERSVRVAQEELLVRVKGRSGDLAVTLRAVGSPLTGEKPGDTSQFEGQSDGLKGVTGFDGVLTKISIRGREFVQVPVHMPGDRISGK